MRIALEREAEICAEAEDAEHAVRQAQRHQPDVCVVGWDIAGGGLHAVQGIVSVAPDTAVIVMAERSDVEDLLAAVRAGAVGYLPGSLDEAQLRRVIRGVAQSEAAVPRTMVRELIHELRATTALGALTEREAQVLGMLRRGHSTSDIAARLQISPITVRRHISELVKKFGVEGRAGLMSPEEEAGRNAGLMSLEYGAGGNGESSGQARAHGVDRRLDPVRHEQMWRWRCLCLRSAYLHAVARRPSRHNHYHQRQHMLQRAFSGVAATSPLNDVIAIVLRYIKAQQWSPALRQSRCRPSRLRLLRRRDLENVIEPQRKHSDANAGCHRDREIHRRQRAEDAIAPAGIAGPVAFGHVLHHARAKAQVEQAEESQRGNHQGPQSEIVPPDVRDDVGRQTPRESQSGRASAHSWLRR